MADIDVEWLQSQAAALQALAAASANADTDAAAVNAAIPASGDLVGQQLATNIENAVTVIDDAEPALRASEVQVVANDLALLISGKAISATELSEDVNWLNAQAATYASFASAATTLLESASGLNSYNVSSTVTDLLNIQQKLAVVSAGAQFTSIAARMRALSNAISSSTTSTVPPTRVVPVSVAASSSTMMYVAAAAVAAFGAYWFYFRKPTVRAMKKRSRR